MARLLGLDLRPSGGAALEAFAAGGDPRALPLSVPMQRRPTCDFSYAGGAEGVWVGKKRGRLG